MPTTIQVSEKLKKRLAKRKTHPRQPFEEVIAHALDILDEDEMELSPAVKRRLARAEKEIASGKTYTTAELRKELGL